MDAGVSAGARCTTTSPRATPCSPRRSSTPTSSPATTRIGVAEDEPRRPPRGCAAMIDQCLPLPGALRDDWLLWVELWLRARAPPGAAPDAATRLYAPHARVVRRDDRRGHRERRVHGRRPRPHADRLLALIDGYGVRVADRRPGDAARARARGDLGGRGAGTSGSRPERLIRQRLALARPSARGRAAASSRPTATVLPSVATIVSRGAEARVPGRRSSAQRTVTGPSSGSSGRRRSIAEPDQLGLEPAPSSRCARPRVARLAAERDGGLTWPCRRGRCAAASASRRCSDPPAARSPAAASRQLDAELEPRRAGAPTPARAPAGRARRWSVACSPIPSITATSRAAVSSGSAHAQRAVAHAVGEHARPARRASRALKRPSVVAHRLGVDRLAPRVDPQPPALVVRPLRQLDVAASRSAGSSWRSDSRLELGEVLARDLGERLGDDLVLGGEVVVATGRGSRPPRA